MKKIIVASNNQHKIKEIKEILNKFYLPLLKIPLLLFNEVKQ